MLAIKDGRVTFIEVKRVDGKTSPLQDDVISELRRQGVEVYVSKSLDEVKLQLCTPSTR